MKRFRSYRFAVAWVKQHAQGPCSVRAGVDIYTFNEFVFRRLKELVT